MPPKMAALLTRKSIPPNRSTAAVGHGRGRVVVGDVDPHAPRRSRPPAAMACAVSLGAGLVDVGDHHRRAGRGQPLGVGAADAAPRAGHDGDLAGKS